MCDSQPPRAARRASLRCSGRHLAAVVLAALGVLTSAVVAEPASAHVSVTADDATRGAPEALLTFRVLNENEDATTVRVEIKLPVKFPLASVRPSPEPGWIVSTTPTTFNPPITTADGALTTGVGTITYTAAPGNPGVPVGGFVAFKVLAGPLPAGTESLAFPTVQTYSDGVVSRWITPTVPGAGEPDDPAPVLRLGAGEGAGALSAAQDAGPGSVTAADLRVTRIMAVIALVVGGAGALFGVGALTHARRGNVTSTPSA